MVIPVSWFITDAENVAFKTAPQRKATGKEYVSLRSCKLIISVLLNPKTVNKIEKKHLYSHVKNLSKFDLMSKPMQNN